jgi:hypothetical protein
LRSYGIKGFAGISYFKRSWTVINKKFLSIKFSKKNGRTI